MLFESDFQCYQIIGSKQFPAPVKLSSGRTTLTPMWRLGEAVRVTLFL